MGMATYKYPDLVNRNKKLIKENADLREQLEEKNTQLAKLMGSAAGSYLALQEQLDEARNEARKYYKQNAIDRDYILQYQDEIKVHRKRAIEVIAKGNDELKEAQERIAELEEKRFINQRASEAMRNMLFDYNKHWRELRRWQNYLNFLERETKHALQRKQ